jgi:hypothetical protein
MIGFLIIIGVLMVNLQIINYDFKKIFSTFFMIFMS